MSKELRQKGQEFAKFLESLPEEQRAMGNNAEFHRAAKEHQEFQRYYNKGKCYLCGRSIRSFKKDTPCIHWLLNPKGFRKNDLPHIANHYGFFQIQSYLRWIANEAGFARNINDIPEEGTGNKLFELTIKYNDLEWAFSCSENDFLGHDSSKFAQHAHYHFQMRVNERPFINYNDYHLPFSEMDVIQIEAMRSNPEKIKAGFSFGEGMSSIFNEENLETILHTSNPEGPYEEATFKIDTIAMAEEGKTISGDDVYALIQEAKEKGVTVASLMGQLPNAETKTIITPGPGVVEQAPRTGRKKRK